MPPTRADVPERHPEAVDHGHGGRPAGERRPGPAAAALAVAAILASAPPAAAEPARPASDPGGYGVDCASKGYLIDRLPDAMRVIADLDGRPAGAFVALLLGRISAESVLVIANPETALAGVYGFDDAGCAYPDGYVLPLEQAERLLRRALSEGTDA